MNKRKKFIPVMLMPFREDKNIDYEALAHLIEFYLEAGAEGLFANCLSSEMFELSKAEMLASVSFIVDKVAGRVPVVATGTFQEPVEQQAAFVRQIYGTGVSAVIAITSLLAREEDDEQAFRNNVYRLLELTAGIPMGFYECPLPYKRLIDPSFLGELVHTGRVKYHKDTSLDLEHIKAKLAATAGVDDFGLYDAYMVHAVQSLEAGSAGLSCIQGNYFPKLIVWLCHNFDNPQLQQQVAQVQEFLRSNMDVTHYAYPASAKYYLQSSHSWMGTACRRSDIEDLDEATKLKLDELKRSYVKLNVG